MRPKTSDSSLILPVIESTNLPQVEPHSSIPRCARRPPPPPSQTLPDVRFRPDRPRQPELLRQLNDRQKQPSSQEMDIFEQQEISKSRPLVKEELKGWYDWLVSHIPKPIKEKAS